MAEKIQAIFSTDIAAAVISWAIYGRAYYYNHSTSARGTREQRPALKEFVDEALPLVEVNLEQLAQPVRAKPNFKSTLENGDI